MRVRGICRARPDRRVRRRRVEGRPELGADRLRAHRSAPPPLVVPAALRERQLSLRDTRLARDLRHRLGEALEVPRRQRRALPEVRHEHRLAVGQGTHERLLVERLRARPRSVRDARARRHQRREERHQGHRAPSAPPLGRHRAPGHGPVRGKVGRAVDGATRNPSRPKARDLSRRERSTRGAFSEQCLLRTRRRRLAFS
mmetsp:Transcript_5132/g.20644  ORF Transcript_5132/g.20644 Transcript_5132/m.20644 type:complete len:200 (-) Transcript_5132:2149-2748(-)